MKIQLPWPQAPRRPNEVEPIGKAYKPWLILSVLILVGSLVLLSVTVVAAFVTFNDRGTPLWAVILGGLSLFGVVLGFGGLFLLMGTAAYMNWRESRRAAAAATTPGPD